MFIHRNTGRRAAAVSLGILTAAALAKLAHAGTPDPFVLVASSNRAGGQPLTSGNYGNAAQRDLERAQALAPEAAFVARNMIAMRVHQNVNSQATAATTLAAAHE